MKTFKEATTVVAADGALEADLDAAWAIGDKLHGGYLMAILGRAVATEAELPHLVSMTTTFLRPPAPGPARVTVDLLRAGRTAGQYRARLEQDGQPCAEALVTQGVLDSSAPWWGRAKPPALPAEDECFRLPAEAPGSPFPVPLLDLVEHRLDPAVLGFAMGQPSQDGQSAGWLRFADGADWDPLSLLIATDPAPPISLTLGLTGWAPTLSLTAYVRRLPAPGPLRFTMRSNEITSSRMDEIVEVWDSADTLVAQATQLAAVRV
ncbi:thioesterase family protein [Paractinoplanes lichenicola]|uniref:Thioesterase family protein n=1 Tax=Paractinoplanes lichenicola TaxID=2802976 RepID=A0ABS1VTL1_9ACTN|nr:thioesterase family protein [Actinoplanes lichenicola]MBL7257796.1 thioesterase family protein [Actinoplanes lichenicola]